MQPVVDTKTNDDENDAEMKSQECEVTSDIPEQLKLKSL